MKNKLRPLWNRFFTFDWKFGLFLILLICIPRFIVVLNAYTIGNNSSVGIIMLISAIPIGEELFLEELFIQVLQNQLERE